MCLSATRTVGGQRLLRCEAVAAASVDALATVDFLSVHRYDALGRFSRRAHQTGDGPRVGRDAVNMLATVCAEPLVVLELHGFSLLVSDGAKPERCGAVAKRSQGSESQLPKWDAAILRPRHRERHRALGSHNASRPSTTGSPQARTREQAWMHSGAAQGAGHKLKGYRRRLGPWSRSAGRAGTVLFAS